MTSHLATVVMEIAGGHFLACNVYYFMNETFEHLTTRVAIRFAFYIVRTTLNHV